MKKFLVIRRDNIGDLICTTPLIRALRQYFPAARIDALVNSYNEPVLANNPDLNNVYAYTKAKHRKADETILGVYWRRVKLIRSLQLTNYDYVIIANCGFLLRPLKLARWVRAKNIIGFVPAGKHVSAINMPLEIDTLPRHEVENVFRLLTPLEISTAPSALRLHASPEEAAAARQALNDSSPMQEQQLVVAIHISARKIAQRWPADRFASLMRTLNKKWNCRFVLLWSPGDENNPLHPGDDGKAQTIIETTKDLPVLAYPTTQLETLIGAVSVCRAMICSDGGAMHIGAGLGLPIVSFFGNSDVQTWYPWGVPCEVLQKPSHHVDDISVEEAVEAFTRLKNRVDF